VLAIDVGGTKLAAGIVGPDGTVAVDLRVPTPRGERVDAEALWSTLVRLAREVLDAAGRPALGGIGAGCGGPMTWPAGEVSPVHIPGWRGFGLRARLAAELGGPDRLPVRVHNDVVCLAVAEHWRGAARGHPNALGMVVSTGVGGGLVLGGRVVDGATGNAGHIGHLVVDPDGPACPCGNRGCLEIVASGTSLARWAAEHGWQPPAGGTGSVSPSARAVAAAALAVDPVAAAAFDRAGRMLGRAIAAAVTLVDVSVVAVGGGVAQSGDLLFAPLQAAYARWARFPYTRAARIVPATLGAAAGLVGAAALVLAGDRYWNAD
jgi:glucokinase